jgi:nucleoside-diphosphate-sugar epimerase
MTTYLVTGGAGFIGSNIVEELLKRGETVRVLDNFLTGSQDNLDFIKNYPLYATRGSAGSPPLEPSRAKSRGNTQYEFIEGDIRSKEDLQRALKGVDYVLHQAAFSSASSSLEEAFIINDINVNGTLNLLYESKRAGVKRLVYASSAACYGDSESPIQRECLGLFPISLYGVSKLAAEKYCCMFSRTFNFETVSLRYFNVFGPRQNPKSTYSAVIPALLSRMLENKPPVVEWDGEQTRDFVYAADIVQANLACAKAEGIAGEAFNVASGESVSILDIVRILNELLGTSLKPEFKRKRPGDIRKSSADISKISNIVAPGIGFHEGLKLTLEWFTQNRERLLKK